MTAEAREWYRRWMQETDLRVAVGIVRELLAKETNEPLTPEQAWAVTEVEFAAKEFTTPRVAANLLKG